MQLLSLLLAVSAAAMATDSEPDVAVVCPAEFRAALNPWLEFRKGQGHTIEIVSNDGSADQIRERIRAAAKPGKLRFVLLVGGANPRLNSDAAVRRRSIPPHLEPAKVIVHWGPETEIASDNWYADLDGDGVPDLAIGRLTVESAAELAAVVKKILGYEQQPDFHRWRSRINFVAGASGFDPVVDALLETTARGLISGGVPAAYETEFTYANWHSAYCPDPRSFHATLVDRLNEGCLFWVYMGHGRRTAIDYLRLPAGRVRSLDCGDMSELHCTAGSPIALFLACYTGALDASPRCLADELLRAPGGPVAIIGGSRTTMPYAMAVFGSEMIDQCFRFHAATVGEAMLEAKRRMVGAGQTPWDSHRLLMDAVAKAASPQGSDLAAERLEHLHLFNLIGDPLLALHFPREMELTAERSATAGDKLEVSGRSPCEGHCTIELVADHDAADAAQPRQKFESTDEALRDYQRRYCQMNHPPLATAEATVESGRFAAALPIPSTAAGRYRLRAFVQGNRDCALGSTAVDVQSTSSGAE
jgi:Peptidase family C25